MAGPKKSNVPKSETFVYFTKITAAACSINNIIPVSIALANYNQIYIYFFSNEGILDGALATVLIGPNSSPSNRTNLLITLP